MASLSLRQAQQLQASLASLYADPQAGSIYVRLSEAIGRLMGVELACFDIFDEQGTMLHLGDDAPAVHTPEALARLEEHVHDHPLFPKLFVEKNPDPMKIGDFCPMQQFYRTDLFNEFFRPIAVTHQLVVGFQVPGLGFAACVLSRSRRDFTEAERVLLAFVQPHLTALMQLAQPARFQVPAGLGLTLREADILRGLAQGHSNKVIAQHYGISPRTVQVHLHRIYAKLEVENRTAAVLLLTK